MRLFQHLALLVHKRIGQTNTRLDRTNDAIRAALVCYMPKGGVFASGTHLDDSSTGEELMFRINYFPPEAEAGKWIGYVVYVRPSLLDGGFSLRVHSVQDADWLDAEGRMNAHDRIRDAFKNALELAVD